jgi:hypothetical protein
MFWPKGNLILSIYNYFLILVLFDKIFLTLNALSVNLIIIVMVEERNSKEISRVQRVRIIYLIVVIATIKYIWRFQIYPQTYPLISNCESPNQTMFILIGSSIDQNSQMGFNRKH